MKKFQEIEQLSAYLDGQLNKADSAKLEARIKSDPELASAISELRAARSILHKLPARKAPRNFTLTRQMVGLKPPLPRSYPLFRFATVFAAILFVFSFTATTLAPWSTSAQWLLPHRDTAAVAVETKPQWNQRPPRQKHQRQKNPLPAKRCSSRIPLQQVWRPQTRHASSKARQRPHLKKRQPRPQ